MSSCLVRDSSSKKQSESRNWCVVAYPSDDDLARVKFDPHIVHYAYIRHISDIKDDGSPKEPHYHFLLTFTSSKKFSAVKFFLERNVFLSGCNVMLEPMVNRLLALEYLTHKNDPDKFQYSASMVVMDDEKYWTESAFAFEDSSNDQFLADLATLSVIDMARKYGRDFIKNSASYLAFRDKYIYRYNEGESDLPQSTMEQNCYLKLSAFND